jgi:rod shape determining protein RodA
MSADRPLLLSRLGWGIALPVVFLAAVGLACIHATDRSAMQSEAAARPADDITQPDPGPVGRLVDTLGPRTTRQLVYFISGLVLMGLVVYPSYRKIGEYTYLAYAVLLVLLILLVVDRYIDLPRIPVRNNSRRWIDFGVMALQPSEFMKPVLILTLARFLRFRDSYRRWAGLAVPFVLTVVPMGLILKQPDLGTTLMLLPVLFAMLFVAGARLRHLALVICLGCATLPIFYMYGMKDYQRERIQVLFKQNVDDEAWHIDQGYQLRQSKIALGTGGIFGEGYGEGMFIEFERLLPEEHNDFIFAIIGHQWGLVGCALVILAYVLIVLFGLEVATATNDPFGRLVAIGVIVMIVVQALLNVCMTIGLAPITGMTLPFVSFGGSSMWANFIGLGLLLNVAQRRPMLIAHPPFEYRDD